MGLSFSRSVRYGPVRFNFSGSGIGVSTGIKGLRIGTGPRGAYISAGLGGFRYRTSIGGGRTNAQGQRVSAEPTLPANDAANIIRSEEHDNVNVLSLTDSSGDALLQSMNEQAKKLMLWPFVGVAFVLGFFLSFQFLVASPGWVIAALTSVSIGITAWTGYRDHLRRLTVLFFEPDAATTSSFSAVVAGAETTFTARKLRSVLETATYADRKYEAGASQGLKLGKASVSVGQVSGVLANIDVPILTSGRTTLAFYPDRVLAFQGKAVGAISYDDLSIESFAARFIETEAVPGDATVIDQTWQYVNKKGGPDRRFKNNRQLPVCKYNRLHLASSGGLDVRLLSSRDGTFDEFSEAVKQMLRRQLSVVQTLTGTGGTPFAKRKPAAVPSSEGSEPTPLGGRGNLVSKTIIAALGIVVIGLAALVLLGRPQKSESNSDTVAQTQNALVPLPETRLAPPGRVGAAGSTTATPGAQPAPSWAPSFDCQKVVSGTLQLICVSETLSAADVRLSQLYAAALARESDKKGFRSAQNQWRTKQRNVCSDVDCLERAYAARIQELSDLLAQPDSNAAKLDTPEGVSGSEAAGGGGPVSVQSVCETMPEPKMPTKALREGMSGDVQAVATIANGHVVAVDIVSSNPRGVFDSAVRSAMMAYECQTAVGQTVRAAQTFTFRLQ